MEENEEDANLNENRAMQVENDGLLDLLTTKRIVFNNAGDVIEQISSYDQKLFIGTNIWARPKKLFVKLHELVARIVHMRGGAGLYNDDWDEGYDAIHEIAGAEMQMDFDKSTHKSLGRRFKVRKADDELIRYADEGNMNEASRDCLQLK